MLEKIYKINLNKMEFTNRLRECFVSKRPEFNAPNIFKEIRIEAISGKIESSTFEIFDHAHYYNSSVLIGKISKENENSLNIALKKGLTRYNYYIIIVLGVFSLLPIGGIIYSLAVDEFRDIIWYITSIVFSMLLISQIGLYNYYWNNNTEALFVFFEKIFNNEIEEIENK